MSNEAIVVRDVDAAVAKAKNFINGSVSLGGGEVGGSILQDIDDVMLRSDYRYTTYYNKGRENRGMYKGVLTEEFWWNPPYGHPRDLDFETLKLFENNEWVQICIDGISDGVTSALWDIVPRVDGEEIADEEKQECEDFFKGINAECSIEEVIAKMLPELICYDSGAVAQVYPVTAYDEFGRLIDGIKPVALNALDGRSILVETHPVGGQRTQYYQYSWMSPISLPTKFELRELMYFQLRPSSRGPYGTSKLEKIKNSVNFLVDSTVGASKMWENALLMGGQIDHPDVTDEVELRRLSAYYREEFQGANNNGKFAITGGNTKITQFQYSPDHMQWLDGQKWFGKIVMSIFKITPSEVGFTEDLNRATGMQQMNIHKSRAIKPILRVIQNKINRDIMWANWPNMMFKYKDVLDLDDTMKQSQIDQIDATIGKITINELRERDGLDKFKDEKFDSAFATAEQPQEEGDEWGDTGEDGWNPWGDTGESTDNEDDDDFKDKGFEGVNKAANVGAGSGEAGFAHGADVKVVDGSKQRAKKEKKREKIQVKIENSAWDELKDFWGNVEDELRTKLFYDVGKKAEIRRIGEFKSLKDRLDSVEKNVEEIKEEDKVEEKPSVTIVNNTDEDWIDKRNQLADMILERERKR